jgi:lysyl endopeptidase
MQKLCQVNNNLLTRSNENNWNIVFDLLALIFILLLLFLLSFEFNNRNGFPLTTIMRHLILLLILTLHFHFSMMAQVGHGGTPYTFGTNLKSLRPFKNIHLALIDNQQERHMADSLARNSGFARQKFYGKGIDMDINLTETSSVTLGDGRRLWLYHVQSENAYAMQFYFDRFNIPKGATLFFYNEEKDMVLGSFTSENNNTNKDFGTQYIKGNSIYIEYIEPANPEFSGDLHIFKAIHVFRDLFKSGQWGSSGTCNIDVSCSIGDGWEKEIASVALILSYNNKYNLASWCSGVLLNNTKKDGTAYFLSAKHCGDTTRMAEGYARQRFDYSTWLFLFNYQDTICNAAGSIRYPTTSVYGANLLAADSNGSLTSDYLLLKLNATSEQLSSYGVAWAGWDFNEQNALASLYEICIHHPSGDVKKISKDNNPPVSSDYDKTQPYFWQVAWNFGTTENVSSGAPLFNANHRLIGQLYGGAADCNNTEGSDYFGKLSRSWVNGHFAQWLDPLGSNPSYLDTYQPNSQLPVINSRYLINPNPSNGRFSIVANDETTLRPISIKIYNSVGKLVKQFTKTVLINNEIDLSQEPKGLYIIQIDTGDGIVVEKVMIL